jgi:hypothetical protein
VVSLVRDPDVLISGFSHRSGSAAGPEGDGLRLLSLGGPGGEGE